MSLMRRTRLLYCIALAWLCLGGTPAWAHETMPAALLLKETAPKQFEVLWRLPRSQGLRIDIEPVLPTDCRRLSSPQQQASDPSVRVLQWSVQCAQGLQHSAQIGFEGLALSLVDVLVRASYLDGASEAQVAHPRTPTVTLMAGAAQVLAVSAYFALGVEHILTGTDHLLFVLCLMLLVAKLPALLKTITAFTLAHSLTLALSALGVVHLAQPPVEATIALSILFLARELLRPTNAHGMAVQRLWLVAFGFGLLHGFGFAGALAEIGLPQEATASALLLFNLGVEAGQLLFVALVYPLVLLLRHAGAHGPRWSVPLSAYAVGAVAGFWWLQRMAVVLGPQWA